MKSLARHGQGENCNPRCFDGQVARQQDRRPIEREAHVTGPPALRFIGETDTGWPLSARPCPYRLRRAVDAQVSGRRDTSALR